jgi:hypothetical protein
MTMSQTDRAFDECLSVVVGGGQVSLTFATNEEAKRAHEMIAGGFFDVSRLQAELASLRTELAALKDEDILARHLVVEAADAAAAELASLRAELEQLRREAVEAMKPFADARMIARIEADNRAGIRNFNSACCVSAPTTIGSLRTARAFVEKHQ